MYNFYMDEANFKNKCNLVLNTLKEDLSTVRTGRASASMVQNILVPAYGGQQRLKILELASITTPDPNQIVIDPWDKSIIGDIKKGILEANVGLNPNIDGEIIRLVIPPMTTEDRQKHVKLLYQKLENGKIILRQARADQLSEIKKAFENKEFSEDQKEFYEKKVQEIVDDFSLQMEKITKEKETEIMNISSV